MECPVCHTLNVPGARFCAQCGAALPEASAQPGYTEVPVSGYGSVPPTPPPGYTIPQPVTGAGGLSDNVASALAYITVIPAILFLMLEPYNRSPLVRFHSFQSICLAVAATAILLVIKIFAFIPFLGLLFWLVYAVVSVAIFILWVLAILHASKGEYYRLPVIGEIALKQSQQR